MSKQMLIRNFFIILTWIFSVWFVGSVLFRVLYESGIWNYLQKIDKMWYDFSRPYFAEIAPYIMKIASGKIALTLSVMPFSTFGAMVLLLLFAVVARMRGVLAGFLSVFVAFALSVVISAYATIILVDVAEYTISPAIKFLVEVMAGNTQAVNVCAVCFVTPVTAMDAHIAVWAIPVAIVLATVLYKK